MQEKRAVTWHGKLVKGMKDDLCMGLMMALWWREEFFKNTAQYGRYIR
jgi:hypothetical protein